MDKLSKEKIKELSGDEADPSVTIYLPMHISASPPHISENQIRLKNLIHQAMQQLPARGTGHELAHDLEQAMNDLHDNLNFWEAQTPGLLILASPGNVEMFHLPIDTEEYVAVDNHFHLAPVLGIMHDARDFYLLALAQRNPKICKGTLYGLEPMRLNLPADAKSALNIDEVNQRIENQGTATGPSSKGAAGQPGFARGWFNGRGGARNTEDEERLRYLRILDHMINDTVDRKLPLILAGTEDETAMYREISRYPKLLREAIQGNHTLGDNRHLFEQARSIIWREVITPEHQAAIEEYQRISGVNPDRALHDNKSIEEAARQGRVDKLLTRMITRTADNVRDSLEDMPRLTFPKSPESKHLNDVALNVWRSSGTIYNLLPNEMPDGALMAASLRY